MDELSGWVAAAIAFASAGASTWYAHRSKRSADDSHRINSEMLELQKRELVRQLGADEVQAEAERIVAMAKQQWKAHVDHWWQRTQAPHHEMRWRVGATLRGGQMITITPAREEVAHRASQLPCVDAVHATTSGYRVHLRFDQEQSGFPLVP